MLGGSHVHCPVTLFSIYPFLQTQKLLESSYLSDEQVKQS